MPQQAVEDDAVEPFEELAGIPRDPFADRAASVMEAVPFARAEFEAPRIGIRRVENAGLGQGDPPAVMVEQGKARLRSGERRDAFQGRRSGETRRDDPAR